MELLNGSDKEKTNEMLTKTFNDADTDNDGALGPEEFKACLMGMHRVPTFHDHI